MIQRIQSIYLLLAAAVDAVLFFVPVASFISADNIIPFYAFGIDFEISIKFISELAAVPLIVLVSMVVLLPLINIFLFKKRKLQMRLCIFAILLNLGLVGLLYFYISTFAGELLASIQYNYPAVMPLIAVVLNYLAFRAVRKDEALIRSIDRIR